MPPRVTYWTGIWQPHREALSKEVQALRGLEGRRATVVSFSTGQRTSLLVRDGVFRLSGRRWLTLRLLAAALERQGDVTHVLGALDEWHLLRAVGRRPVLFTVAHPGTPADLALHRKVALFAAETEALAGALRRTGVLPDRIRVIRPGVDLQRYAPKPSPPPHPFRLLFASTPADPAEFDVRGIPLLVDVARRCPEVEILLLWRTWGNTDAARDVFARLNPPSNIKMQRRAGRSMESIYQGVHATICAYADAFGKSCPNSLIEGLSCGRPALVTRTCGLADLLETSEGGIAAARDPDDLVAAIERLRRHHARYCVAARALAEQCFDLRTFQSTYAELYAKLAAGAIGRESEAARALPSVSG